MPSNWTTATTLRIFVDALADLDVAWEPMLRACDIDPALLDDPEARIPPDRFDRVWTTAARFADDPCIGLHAGAKIRPRAVNIFGYLLLSSATLGEGLRRVAAYQRALTSEPWIAILEDDEECVRIRVGMEDGEEETRAIHAEYVALLILAFLSWVAGEEVDPLEAHFRHEARGPKDEYVRLLRSAVWFGCEENELVFTAGTLDRPSLHADPHIAQMHDEFAARLLAEAQQGSAIGRTRHALGVLLEGGSCDLNNVANRLRLSARTLQRRLSEEGSSFRDVVDSLRRDLALEHLQRRDTPICEVAYLEGFADVSAFTRAVRRWFDHTPGELRRQGKERGEGPERG